MSNVCKNCGATYIESDGYCKNCWTKVSDDVPQIKGLAKCEWDKYIGKNADRYMGIFEKNEGKKAFFSLNFAALLFSFNWMFYRKMYKYALIYLLITVLFTFAVYGAVYGIYKNDIVLYEKLDAQYAIFRAEEQEESEFTYNSKGEITGIKIDYPDFIDEYNAVVERLSFLPAFLIWFLPFAMQIFLSLLADCTYRAHVYEKLRAKQQDSGGTSVGMVFASMAINAAVNIILVTPVLEKFTNFFEF